MVGRHTLVGGLRRSIWRGGIGASAPLLHCSARPTRPCARPASRRLLQPVSAAGVAIEPGAEADLGAEAGLSTLVDAQMSWPARSHLAGLLREEDAGKEVTVCGWVDRNRDLGGIVFMDVRDHTGLLQVRLFCLERRARSSPRPERDTHAKRTACCLKQQPTKQKKVVCEPQTHAEAARVGARLRAEYVVAVTGTLRARKDPNPKMATGRVELLASSIKVLNAVSRLLPFPVSAAEEAEAPREELRLRHRVLDLRFVFLVLFVCFCFGVGGCQCVCVCVMMTAPPPRHTRNTHTILIKKGGRR